MDVERILADIDGRLRRIEETLSRLTAAQGQLGRAMNATLFSQSVYLGDHRALTFLQNGQKIFVDTRSIDVGTHLLLDGWWEPDYMAAFGRLLKPGQCVLDIGANHGIYALVAAQRVGPRGKVVAFEPNAQLCDLLRASVSVNGLENIVEVVQCAVSNADGEAVLAFDEHWAARGQVRSGVDAPSTTCGTSARSERVRRVAIDSFFANADRPVDLVKMDVEGSEGLVLDGMKHLVERSPHLRIMMEFCPSMLSTHPRDAGFVIEFLESRKFMAWAIESDGTVKPVPWSGMSGEPDVVRNIIASREAIA
ncbi:MAG TPA: FkbM family methyltransferase [Casimicrobiaceae bacterium]|nr:FkbM family methyltransferase [Casimicrobiaceae bacterium]